MTTTTNPDQYNEFIKVVRKFTIDGEKAATQTLGQLDPDTADLVYNELVRPLIAAHASLARWTSDQLGFDVVEALEDALAD